MTLEDSERLYNLEDSHDTVVTARQELDVAAAPAPVVVASKAAAGKAVVLLLSFPKFLCQLYPRVAMEEVVVARVGTRTVQFQPPLSPRKHPRSPLPLWRN